MLTDNATPFSAIGFEQWHRDGPTMAVVAVRGSFLVGPGGALELAETQQIVLADEFAGDPQKSPLVRLSDLVPFKPGTDVTFLGSAHAPQGQPLASISAALSIAGRRVEICATGPRQWRAVQDSWILSEPEPVDVVPVCYTLASGGRIIGDPEGTVDPRNPIGPGLIDPDVTPRNRDFPAPRLFNSRDPLHDDFARPPRPAGLGPMAPWWAARQNHAGTYDDAWKDKTHPRLPADFDYRFYNCAHPYLILPGHLSGGALLELENLSPAGREHIVLPAEVPVARFSYTDGREVEVALNFFGCRP